MLNIDQLRKVSRLKAFRDFRGIGRREIGDSEYNSVEEICYKWKQRKRRNGQRLFCLCLCYFFPSEKQHICVLMGVIQYSGEN